MRSVLLQCNGQQPPHGTRKHHIDVPPITRERLHQVRAQRRNRRDMPLVLARGAEFIPSIGQALSRFAALGEQVFADALEKRLHDGGRQRRILEELPHIPRQQIEIGMVRSARNKALRDRLERWQTPRASATTAARRPRRCSRRRHGHEETA